VRDKDQLTHTLISQLPPDSWTFDDARKNWWYNIRKGGGLRLTAVGYYVLVRDLEIEHYAYTIPDSSKITQRTILALDRNLQSPYYIHIEKHKIQKLIFFGSKEAMLANLYGDLEKFLKSYT
jgi:hypothetical protein